MRSNDISSASVNEVPLEKLRLYYVMFKKFLEMTTDGFIAIDEHDRILEIDPTLAERLEFSYEDVIGRHIHEVIPNSRMPLAREEGVHEKDKPFNFTVGKLKGQVVLSSRSTIIIDGKHIAAISQTRYPEKSHEFSELFSTAYNELNSLADEFKRLMQGRYSFDDIIGNTPQLALLKKQAGKAAELDFTVLVRGETGTGKELMAHAIHNASNRAKEPFICVNCAAIPHELLESELFGYDEGAFTGASRKGKAGKIELANRGTLFLDEIGDMPMTMQAKILRVLQDKKFERLGSSATQQADVRIIAATNQELEQKVAENEFRADLFYRLNVINLMLPPLRERVEDIPLLARYILDGLNTKFKTFKQFAPQTLEALKNYSWPGNIRELRNVVERAYSFSEGYILQPADLPSQLFSRSKLSSLIATVKGENAYAEIMDSVEREIIFGMLDRYSGDLDAAARALGMHKTTLYRKMKKLGRSK